MFLTAQRRFLYSTPQPQNVSINSTIYSVVSGVSGYETSNGASTQTVTLPDSIITSVMSGSADIVIEVNIPSSITSTINNIGNIEAGTNIDSTIGSAVKTNSSLNTGFVYTSNIQASSVLNSSYNYQNNLTNTSIIESVVALNSSTIYSQGKASVIETVISGSCLFTTSTNIQSTIQSSAISSSNINTGINPISIIGSVCSGIADKTSNGIQNISHISNISSIAKSNSQVVNNVNVISNISTIVTTNSNYSSNYNISIVSSESSVVSGSCLVNTSINPQSIIQTVGKVNSSYNASININSIINSIVYNSSDKKQDVIISGAAKAVVSFGSIKTDNRFLDVSSVGGAVINIATDISTLNIQNLNIDSNISTSVYGIADNYYNKFYDSTVQNIASGAARVIPAYINVTYYPVDIENVSTTKYPKAAINAKYIFNEDQQHSQIKKASYI